MTRKDDSCFEQAEIARLTKEVAVLTRVIERQREELKALLERFGGPGFDTNLRHEVAERYAALTKYARDMIRDLLSAAAAEVKSVDAEKQAGDDIAIASILARTNILDEDWYLKANSDVKRAGLAAHDHYSRYGIHEDRPPNEMLR